MPISPDTFALVLSAFLTDWLLVACRLLGLLVTIPGFHLSAVPWYSRCLLLVVVASVITPNVSLPTRQALNPTSEAAPQLESDQSARLASHAEVPPIADGRLNSSQHGSSMGTTLDFVGTAICEIGLGLLLGIGANLLLHGLRMAGQLIDQQTGWGVVTNSPVDGEETSGLGEFYFQFGGVLLFVLGGHLLLISTLMRTFTTFPPGQVVVGNELLPLAGGLLEASCSVALQLSAPVLAAQLLMGLVLNHAMGNSPALQNSGSGLIVRMMIALGVLILALSGITGRLIELIPESIHNTLLVWH